MLAQSDIALRRIVLIVAINADAAHEVYEAARAEHRSADDAGLMEARYAPFLHA